MSLQEKALAHGSDPAGITQANERDFLLKCLKVAQLDPELQNDVADACELYDYTALSLASGDLTVSSIEAKLYLTGDEASTLIKVCERECAKLGVTFGRPIEPEPIPSAKVEEPTDAASSVAAVPPVSTARDAAETHASPLRLDVDSPTTPDLPEKNRETSPGPQTQEKKSSSKKLASPKPSASPEHSSDKRSDKSATQRGATTPKSRPVSVSTPTSVQRQLSRSSSSGVPQPTSARKPPMRRSSSKNVDSDTLSQASGTSEGRSDVPSYLRPTAAHKARAQKVEVESNSGSRPTSAQTTPRKHTVPVAGFISNTLLRPTAAFLNRFVPPKDESGKWSPTEGGRLTQSVSSVPSSSKVQTPRSTRVQPFHLSTELRGSKDKVLSTEEIQMQKAKEEMDKLKQIKSPKGSRPSSAHDGEHNIKTMRSASHSARKPTQFKPFNLASLERHQKAQEDLQRRIAEERAKEEEERGKHAKKPSSRNLASGPGRTSSKRQSDLQAEATS